MSLENLRIEFIQKLEIMRTMVLLTELSNQYLFLSEAIKKKTVHKGRANMLLAELQEYQTVQEVFWNTTNLQQLQSAKGRIVSFDRFNMKKLTIRASSLINKTISRIKVM